MPMSSEGTSVRLSTKAVVVSVLCVILVHVAIVSLLCEYGNRIRIGSLSMSSEFFVFYLPGSLALICYLCLLRVRGFRVAAALLIAILLTFISVWLSVFIIFIAFGNDGSS
jgi:hypothetical protein